MTEDRRRDDPRIQILVEHMTVAERTHAKMRDLVDDVLRLSGEQIKTNAKLAVISAAVQCVSDDTAIIREAVIGARSFWNFCSRWGNRIMWLGKRLGIIAGVITAIYVAIEHIAQIDIVAAMQKILRIK